MGSSEGNKNRKKIGFIGLGSIGLKHLQALQVLGVEEFFHFKTGRGSKSIPDELSSMIRVVHDLNEFEEVDGVIIANPTALHGAAIRQVLPLNKPIFVEKPLTDKLEESEELCKLLKGYSARIQIGFCLRFHPLVQKIKEVIETAVLGNIYFARLDVGQYLPNWHPYTDYSKEYFSIKAMGGGAIRTLSHEIDLALYFFGKPEAVTGNVFRLSNLEIDVDDYSSLLLKYNSSIVNINIDFLSRRPIREGIIMGTQGDLYYNMIDNKAFLINDGGNKIELDIDFEQNMYVNQMHSFIEKDKGGINYAGLNDSQIVMDIIHNVENSSKNIKWKKL